MKGIGRTIKRRRRESKTDYKARMGLLKSNKPRLVVRRTNRYLVAQIVEHDIAQDKIILSISSKDLLNNGWPEQLKGSLKSIAAAYLTGKLLASKTKQKEVILDIGMHRNMHKGRIYALVKGCIDGGMKIPHAKESLPDEKVLENNKKTREAFIKLKG